jgi:APA family basic amino acid/polyamine antiporter
MPRQLHRSLTLTQLVFYGVGTIVGAGIYTIIGAAAGIAGNLVWASLVVSAIAAFIIALSYAELIAAFPKAGAEYHFLRAGFPRARVLSFAAGFFIALNSAATCAAVSLAFAGYLRVFFPIPAALIALVLLACCTAINIVGIRQSTGVTIALICVEVAGLLMMIGGGLVTTNIFSAIVAPSWQDAGAIVSGAAMVFFIYIGFEDVANLAEEAKAPKTDVPRALLLSCVVTSLIYLFVVWSVLAVADPASLADSESPLTAAGRQIAPWLGTALAITALFATASTALISMISISRLLFGMAREGDMPAALSLTTRRKTPWVAALVLFALACIFLPLGEVKLIASVSSTGILLVFIGVQASLIRLRYLSPKLKRPFRIPMSIGKLPLIPALGIAVCLGLLSQFEPPVYLIIAGAAGVAAVVYAFMRRGKAGRASH